MKNTVCIALYEYCVSLFVRARNFCFCTRIIQSVFVCIRATTDARIVNLCSYVANNSFSSIIFSIILRVTSYFL